MDMVSLPPGRGGWIYSYDGKKFYYGDSRRSYPFFDERNLPERLRLRLKEMWNKKFSQTTFAEKLCLMW